MTLALNIACDSGAFSLRTRKHKFADTYLDKYAEFCHKYLDRFTFYVTLDVIDDTKKTWENLKYLESCGLKPLPVFHAKHDRAWLFKLLNNYEHIGFGGLIHTVVKYRRFDIVNDLFSNVWDRNSGKISHKVHGFGVSNGRLLCAYPWHTVDSTTPFTQARNGVIMIPRPIMKAGKVVSFDYINPFLPVPCTERRSDFTWHSHGLGDTYKMVLQMYLDELEVKLEDVPTWGYTERDLANLYFVAQMTKQAEAQWSEKRGMQHSLSYYVSGKPGHSPNDFAQKTLPRLAEITGGLGIGYLGTFFDPQCTKKLLELTNGTGRSKVRIKTRRAVFAN